MSRIKLVAVILICIFLLPFMVNADECNLNNIKIKNINVKDKSEYVEELNEVTFKDNKINLDLKMYDVGDYIEYTLKVKNESDEIFYFDENSLIINSNYFDYSISYKDNSNKINPNKEKTIYLRVQYKKEVERENFFSGKYKDSNIVSLLLTDNKRSIFTNPLTGSNKIILLLISMIILGIYLYYKKTNNIRLNIFIIIGLSLLIPISTYALCEVKLDINSNITIGKIKPNPCTYDGNLVQGTEYVNGQYTYRYMQEMNIKWDSTIYAFKHEFINIEQDGWGVVLTDEESTESVSTKLCTTINDKPIVSSSGMFASSKTSSIDLSSFDTSNIVNMDFMFFETNNDSEEFNIFGLDNFDTSNVISMNQMFRECGRNSEKWSIGDISRWDVSKVTNMYGMFEVSGYNSDIYHFDLSNWNTHNVTNMSYMFAWAGMKSTTWDIGDLSKWDISNVTDISYMFDDAGYSTLAFNIGDLSKWDTSKVNNMSSMFNGAGYNAINWSIGDLSGWDTSKVSDMKWMFSLTGANTEVWSIGNLSKWDTSNVTSMWGMFNNSGTNASKWYIGDLSSWNTSKVTDMSSMFSNTGKNAREWSIGDLSNWDTSKVTNMSFMFDRAGTNASEWKSLGTLNIYSTNINQLFNNCPNGKVTLNLYKNPVVYTDYFNAFWGAATSSGSGIIVNYTSDVTNIDDIIATKSSNSNVVKGSLIN